MKTQFKIEIRISRNDGEPDTKLTFVGRKRAFKDGARVLWMQWVYYKHRRRHKCMRLLTCTKCNYAIHECHFCGGGADSAVK